MIPKILGEGLYMEGEEEKEKKKDANGDFLDSNVSKRVSVVFKNDIESVGI